MFFKILHCGCIINCMDKCSNIKDMVYYGICDNCKMKFEYELDENIYKNHNAIYTEWISYRELTNYMREEILRTKIENMFQLRKITKI